MIAQTERNFNSQLRSLGVALRTRRGGDIKAVAIWEGGSTDEGGGFIGDGLDGGFGARNVEVIQILEFVVVGKGINRCISVLSGGKKCQGTRNIHNPTRF